MITLLAIAVGIIGAALAHRAAVTESTIVRIAAIVAGFIVGYVLTVVIATNVLHI